HSAVVDALEHLLVRQRKDAGDAGVASEDREEFSDLDFGQADLRALFAREVRVLVGSDLALEGILLEAEGLLVDRGVFTNPGCKIHAGIRRPISVTTSL